MMKNILTLLILIFLLLLPEIVFGLSWDDIKRLFHLTGPEPELKCDSLQMNVGQSNKCTFTNCNQGLWVLVNKQGFPLEYPIVKYVSSTDNKIEFIAKSQGKILAKGICLDPLVVKEEIIEVSEIPGYEIPWPPEITSTTSRVSPCGGECPYGSSETRECGDCGTQWRFCSCIWSTYYQCWADCRWTPYGSCADPCAPEETSTIPWPPQTTTTRQTTTTTWPPLTTAPTSITTSSTTTTVQTTTTQRTTTTTPSDIPPECASRNERCDQLNCCPDFFCKQDLYPNLSPTCCHLSECAADWACFESGSVLSNKICVDGEWVDYATTTTTIPSSYDCPDINRDGIVDNDDLVIIENSWHNINCPQYDCCTDYPEYDCDLDNDNDVDIVDIMKVSANLGKYAYELPQCISDCSYHSIKITSVQNSDGKISVSYKSIGVVDNVYVKLITSTPNRAGITNCEITSGMCSAVQDEEGIYFLYAGESVVVDGKTIKLENVASTGSVRVDVDGTVYLVSETKTVNDLKITIIDYHYDDYLSDRWAKLGIIVTNAYTYCTVYTTCKYPTFEPDTKYTIKVIDKKCEDVFDIYEIFPGYVCSDSDDGRNYYVKGTVTYCVGDLCTKKTDICTYCTGLAPAPVTCGAVVEYYCEGNDIQSETYVCPNICQDGACIEESTTTTTPSVTLSCPDICYLDGDCECSVLGCEDGYFIAKNKEGTPLDPEIIEEIDITSFTYRLELESTGKINVTVLCSSPNKHETTLIDVRSKEDETFIIGDITCDRDEEECTIDIDKNTVGRKVTIFVFLINEPKGEIYYWSEIDINPEYTGTKTVSLEYFKTCPHGTRLKVLALAYRYDDLDERIDRYKGDTFRC